jgi:hypothetical protein
LYYILSRRENIFANIRGNWRPRRGLAIAKIEVMA